jgi:hypothetical protein
VTKELIFSVDLDSTLADTRHRQHMLDRVNGSDWDAYALACAEDVLVNSVAALVRALAQSMEVHYVSGRSEVAYDLTYAWLKRHDLPVDGLWLDNGEGGNYEDHVAYKLARVRQVEQETGKRVALHIDDWATVADRFERAGIPCLCVRTPTEMTELLEGVVLT